MPYDGGDGVLVSVDCFKCFRDQEPSMPVFQVESHVDAPVERVWSFHSTVEGLEALTPNFLRLEVLEVRGPDGDRVAESSELVEGSELSMRLAPFRAVPSLTWTSRIVERVQRPGEAYFVDEMVEGPFDHWRHRHDFTSMDDGTRVEDRLEYELPWWMLGRFGWPMFELQARLLFRHRHRELARLIE